MIRKSVSLLLGVLLLCQVCPASSKNASVLRMHLPRTVRVRGESLRLGRIGVIRGSDVELCKKVSDIPIGRMPWSGEKIIFDRRAIRSRLASAGISPSMVWITGAEKVTVMLDETTFEAAKLIRSAEAFLEKNHPSSPGYGWRRMTQVKDLVIPVTKDIELIARPAKDSPKGYAKVEVAVTSAGRELAKTDLLFKRLYPAQQAFAIRDIAPGETITLENTRIALVSRERQSADKWVSAYGMVAVNRIPAETAIRPSLVKTKKPTIIVRRNQTVQMKIQGRYFLVTASGKALQDGCEGDWIRVQNIDTNRIIGAKVASDGTVRPNSQ